MAPSQMGRRGQWGPWGWWKVINSNIAGKGAVVRVVREGEVLVVVREGGVVKARKRMELVVTHLTAARSQQTTDTRRQQISN